MMERPLNGHPLTIEELDGKVFNDYVEGLNRLQREAIYRRVKLILDDETGIPPRMWRVENILKAMQTWELIRLFLKRGACQDPMWSKKYRESLTYHEDYPFGRTEV